MISATVKTQETKPIKPAGKGIVMGHVLIITQDNEAADTLRAEIFRGGYNCSVASFNEAQNKIEQRPPCLIIIDESQHLIPGDWENIVNIKKQKKLPVMVLAAEENLTGPENNPEIDDFIIYPCKTAELLLRIKRLLKKSPDHANPELIKCDGLTIDLATCEVTVDGKKADLTFKEYEVLKLMAGNRGRVFTREALLDKIWGYDYYGGDRTVDVHMRRLRSKIEDADHTYIETVRNIGYRFTKGSQP